MDSKNSSRRGSPANPHWASLSDEELLEMRLCDFGLKIDDTLMAGRIHRIYEELERRQIYFRPHAWLSSEWFSPDGIPGIAIPFYLMHERLMKLEYKMMLEVEGGPVRQCMKLLRHESGHAICSAFRLHYKPRWREVFGKSSQPYPDYYQPKPRSRDYVLHLDWWYAQAHPSEDFAETFAVWLTPGSRWRREYRDWPALRKLERVDELMTEIAGAKPVVRSKKHIEPLKQLTITLREHYRRKQERYSNGWPDFYDRDLHRLFSADPKYKRRESAASFLRRVRPEIRRAIGTWTGEHMYTIDQVLREMIERCKELNLRRASSEREALQQTLLMVTVQIMRFLHGTRHQIPV